MPTSEPGAPCKQCGQTVEHDHEVGSCSSCHQVFTSSGEFDFHRRSPDAEHPKGWCEGSGRPGQWTPIARVENPKRPLDWYWLVICACGKQSVVAQANLHAGTSTACMDCRAAAARIDLSGERFGSWTVVDQAPIDGKGGARWNVVCDCGTTGVVRGSYLRQGGSNGCASCGNLTKVKDLTGQRFGQWVVRGRSPVQDREAAWECVCDCGNTALVRGTKLRSGGSTRCKSCAARGWTRPSGPNHPRWVADDQVNYGAVRKRLRDARGPASAQRCVTCRKPAQSWAYQYGDPDERIGEHGGRMMLFSPNLDAYVPMCARCRYRHEEAARNAEVDRREA